MSPIPLHLERRFEQRWDSRFTLPDASNAPKSAETKAMPSAPTGRRSNDQKKPASTLRA